MWILAAESVEGVFLERGILGALVLVLGWFAWVTIKRLQTERDESLQRERELNKLIYEKVIPVIDAQTALVYEQVIPVIQKLSTAGEARATLDHTVAEVLTDVRRLLEQRHKE